LEAKVLLSSDGAMAPLLDKYRCELADLFIVSQVGLETGGEGLNVTVEHADGAKCERCWKYTTDVGTRPEVHAAICAECAGEVERFLQ
jgi:isoleucyl-tRNA synthetase